MFQPLVSIVIPVYNQANFLDRTIQSVLNQEYKNIQCIVVDDGSSDNSYLVAKKYSPKILLIHQANAGQAAALSSGFERADGEFIGYLSSDDTIDSSLVSKLIKFVLSKSDKGPIVVFPRYRTINEFDSTINMATNSFSGVKDMVENFRCMIGPGAIFSKNIIEICGGWNTKYRQIPDYEFWLRTASVAEFYQLDEVLASFRVHGESQTFAKSSVEKSDESLSLILAVKNNKVHLPLEIRFSTFCASAYVYSACLHFRSARMFTGLSRCIKAISYSWSSSMNWGSARRIAASILASFKLHEK